MMLEYISEYDDDTPSSSTDDGDDLAASWGASLEGSSDASDDMDTTDKILSQDEIDSLLGMDNDAGGDGKSGIFKLLNSENIHYERLPMLEVVFDRLVRLLSTSLRNFTSENVEITLESFVSIRFGDYLNSIPLPAMINIFKARQWNDFGIVTTDSSLIYSIVDVLLGGRRGNALMRIEGRPYTTIERKLIQRLIEVILSDLEIAFEPLCDINFDYDRLETNPVFAGIARPSNASIVARLRVEMEDRGGKIEFLIPYATVEPIRDLLLQTFMGEKFGQDSIWETHLANKLWATQFTLHAFLDEIEMPLSEVLSWEKGSQILLNATPDSRVFLKCGDRTLFAGHMGKKGQHIAVKIHDDFMGDHPEFQEELQLQAHHAEAS